MSPRAAAMGWAGLSLGALTLGVVSGLLAGTLRPAAEIRRYSEDIVAAAEGIVANLEGAAELDRTRALVTAVPSLLAAHLGRGES